MGPRLLIALFGLVASFEAVPSLVANTPVSGQSATAGPSRSFLDHWEEQLIGDQELRAAVSSAATTVAGATVDADAYQATPRDAAMIERAADAVRRHEYAEAWQLVRMLTEVTQSPEHLRRIQDIGALAGLGVGEFEGVVNLVPLDENDTSPLAPYRALWLARAALAVGDGEVAHAAASHAAASSSRSPILHESRMTTALALLETEDRVAEGIRAVERELERYPEYPFMDRVQVRLAHAELDLDREDDAARRLRRLVWDRPFMPRADEARELHESIAGPIDEARGTISERLERGRQLRLRRHWEVAEGVLRATLADAADGGESRSSLNEIRFQLALNAYDSARFTDALEMMDAIRDAGNVGVSQYNRATWRARTLSRLGREDEAFDVLSEYYEQRSSGERDRRLYEFAMDLGMWSRALELLDQRFDRERDWQSWEGAFTNYMAGRHDRAARLWAAMAERRSGENRARAQYWQARAFEHLGRIQEALDLYSEVASDQPWRYYGLQSRNRTREWMDVLPELAEGETYDGLELPTTPTAGPGRIHWNGFGSAPSALLSDVHFDDRDEFFGGYPPELEARGAVRAFADAYGEQFPEAIVAADLLDVGAKEAARKEFRDAIVEFRALDYSFVRGRRVRETRPIRLGHELWGMFIDNRSPELGWWGIELDELRWPTPSRSSARAEYARRQMFLSENRDEVRSMIRAAAREVGDYYMVRRFALDDDLDTLHEEQTDIRWHEAYPRAYGESLREHVERYDLNPFLVWALMIVESDMNPDTVSHAFAYGLLQVIPKTGTLCALLFGETDFGINELLEVDGSIRYGTWYLDQLLTKFHGQEMLAMVAYNAGPHQVQRWLEWRGDDMAMDEFIETVPYDGARRYPQRILRYVSIFRAVNGLDRNVYLGNTLDPTFEDNIYF